MDRLKVLAKNHPPARRAVMRIIARLIGELYDPAEHEKRVKGMVDRRG